MPLFELTSEQKEEIKARTEAWNELSKHSDFDVASDSDTIEEGASLELDALPEEVLLAMMAYAGVPCRGACRAARRCCDAALHEDLSLPSFPVSLRVQQHYHFGLEIPVTTTWQLKIESPSAPGELEVLTATDGDVKDGAAPQRLMQSGAQVLGLCRELRSLQRTLGARHRENGRTQVEVAAIDAAGRTLLDHAYQHRFFRSKADELLEMLTDADAPAPSQACGTSSERGALLGRRGAHA